MPYYYPILNEKLRQLVMASESIHSMNEREIQKMITQIATLPEEGQTAMIAALEDEQKQIQAAKLAKGITPEMELEEINANMVKVTAIKHEFDGVVRKERERVEISASEEAAEAIIQNI